MTVKGGTYGEDSELGFCVETCSEVRQGKRRLAVAPDIVSAISNVSVSVEK